VKVLDGKEIEKSDRLVAKKQFDSIRQRLIEKKASLTKKESTLSLPLDESMTPEE
jgi:hypothetical protein